MQEPLDVTGKEELSLVRAAPSRQASMPDQGCDELIPAQQPRGNTATEQSREEQGPRYVTFFPPPAMSDVPAKTTAPGMSTSFFSGAKGVDISGNAAFTVNHNSQSQDINLATTDPIRFLMKHIAPDALVDSGDRRDPPQCAPKTRDEIHRQIKAWADSPVGEAMIFWLFGSAGAGKSAICQTIAEVFKHDGMLLGNFFFSRSAASTGRSNGDRLLPTLIHQLQQAIPETRPSIEKAIRNDPLIFQKTRASQMLELYIKPLKKLYIRNIFRRHSFGKKVRLVVIDGLDECQDADVQCDLLRVIADAIKVLPIPVRFLIASRPEARINDTIHHDPSFEGVNLKSMDLDQDRMARQAVLQFLLAEFARIRKTCSYLDPSWPSEQVIQTLGNMSTPQFILASTVIRYISDPTSGDHPDKLLNDIINYGSCMDSEPFDNIDILYRFIFAGVKQKYRKKVWCILGVIHLASGEEYDVPHPTLEFLDDLLGHKQNGTAYLMLRPLASVISIPAEPNKPVRSLHASLFDFLLEPRRAGTLLLDLASSHLALSKWGLNNMMLERERWRLESHIDNCIRHMTSIPAAGEALELFNTLLDFLEKPYVYSSLGNITSVYNTIFISSQSEPSHATLLRSRLQLCEERHLSCGRTKDFPNPFVSTRSKLLHYIFINKLTEIGEPFLLLLDSPDYLGALGTNLDYSSVFACIYGFHCLSAIIILLPKYAELLDFLWDVEQQKKVKNLYLEHPKDSPYLLSVTREIVLDFFHYTKTPPGVENLVYDVWSKDPLIDITFIT